VAEYGAIATREDRRHPVPARAEDVVADRVDAGVNAVEPPSVGADRDCLPADAERYELAGRDNAVLAGREGADRPVQRGLDEFVKHSLTLIVAARIASRMAKAVLRVGLALRRNRRTLLARQTRRVG
jgi:hypothetical protein